MRYPIAVLMGLVITVGFSGSSANAHPSQSTLSFVRGFGFFAFDLEGGKGHNRFAISIDKKSLQIEDRSGAPIKIDEDVTGREGFRCSGSLTSSVSCAGEMPGSFSIEDPKSASDVEVNGGCLNKDWAPSFGIAVGRGSTVSGGSRDDEISAGAKYLGVQALGKSAVSGCGGADFINIGRGRANGGSGSDYVYSDGYARLNGGKGRDEIALGDGRVWGGPGRDQLTGYAKGEQSVVIYAQGGNDSLTADTRGNNRLLGGRGNDDFGVSYRGKTFYPNGGVPYELQWATGSGIMNGGPGRDSATVGRNTRLKNCEQVERLPRKVSFL